MGTNNLSVKVVHLDEAVDYEEPEWVGLDLTDALVIKEGTTEGNPTVDLRLRDEHGNKYVAMMTGGIIEMLAGVISGSKQ